MLVGVVSYVPGVDWGLTLEMFGMNLSGVFSILGLGIWRCDHTSRRVFLVFLHVPVLLVGVLSYELLSHFLSPSYSVAVKNIATLWDVVFLLGLGLVVFGAAYVPAYVLGDRKVKLLFSPAREKKGLPKIDREKTQHSVSRKTILALAFLSVAGGLSMAGIEGYEEVVFLDVLEFRNQNREQLLYIEDFAAECSRVGGYVSYSSDPSVMMGSGWTVTLEPAFSAAKPYGATPFEVWPDRSVKGVGLETLVHPSPLPLGYEFSFPVLYEGEAFSEQAGERRPVWIYRDWVRASGSSISLQLVVVSPVQ